MMLWQTIHRKCKTHSLSYNRHLLIQIWVSDSFEAVETSYKISNDVLCINEDIAMCRYEFSVSGLHDKVNIVSQNGMMYVQFDKESRKIKELEMIFDVMSFMQQLQRSALLLPEQCIIPNTIEMALQHCIEARTLVTNSDPLCISYINEGWSSQFGCTQVCFPIVSITVLCSNLIPVLFLQTQLIG